jgi:hypothetical protein
VKPPTIPCFIWFDGLVELGLKLDLLLLVDPACAIPYDTDISSTMSVVAKSYLDSPATTSSVRYELWWYTLDPSPLAIALNMTYSNTDSPNFELGTSQMILQEYFA